MYYMSINTVNIYNDVTNFNISPVFEQTATSNDMLLFKSYYIMEKGTAIAIAVVVIIGYLIPLILYLIKRPLETLKPFYFGIVSYLFMLPTYGGMQQIYSLSTIDNYEFNTLHLTNEEEEFRCSSYRKFKLINILVFIFLNGVFIFVFAQIVPNLQVKVSIIAGMVYFFTFMFLFKIVLASVDILKFLCDKAVRHKANSNLYKKYGIKVPITATSSIDFTNVNFNLKGVANLNANGNLNSNVNANVNGNVNLNTNANATINTNPNSKIGITVELGSNHKPGSDSDIVSSKPLFDKNLNNKDISSNVRESIEIIDQSHDKNINLKYNEIDNDEIEEIDGHDSSDNIGISGKEVHGGVGIDLNADINFDVNDMDDEIKIKDDNYEHEAEFRSNISSKNQNKLNVELSHDNSSHKVSHKSSKNQKHDFGIELGEIEIKNDEIENNNDFTNTINYPNEGELVDQDKRKMDSGVNLNFNVDIGANTNINPNVNVNANQNVKANANINSEDNKMPAVPVLLKNKPKEHTSPHIVHNDNHEQNLSNWDSPDHKQNKSKNFEDDNLKMADKIELNMNVQQPSTFFNTELKVSGSKKPDNDFNLKLENKGVLDSWDVQDVELSVKLDTEDEPNLGASVKVNKKESFGGEKINPKLQGDLRVTIGDAKPADNKSSHHEDEKEKHVFDMGYDD